MARKLRFAPSGCPVHIVQRGLNRSACFYAVNDFRRYLVYLQELACTFRCAVHAYVLMTNHVHLLLTPELADSASLLMKNLGQRYVQYVNRVYSRSGTLWEGRFRSNLIADESHVLQSCRYIELNPVRAQMVRHPRDYPWSSYRTNAEGAPCTFLVPHALYAGLGTTDSSRQAAYRMLFAAETTPPRGQTPVSGV